MSVEPVFSASTIAEAWNIMRDDVTLRHSLITRVLDEQRQQDLLALAHEDRQKGNSGYYLPARVELEVGNTNDRAQALFDACCEIWDIQRLPKNRVFYRAVFHCCLEILFEGRRSAVLAELALLDVRLNSPGQSSAAGASLARRMDQLRSRWDARLEKETRDSEIRERVKRASNPMQNLTKMEHLKIDIPDESAASALVTERNRRAWDRAMDNPARYRTLSPAQVAYGLQRHSSTIYRLIAEGKLVKSSSGITTESVLAYQAAKQ